MPSARTPKALATLAAVGLAVTAFISSTAPAQAAPDCPDIEVVFARGTDEVPGLGKVGQALVETLQPMVKGKSIGTYAVRYPASWDFAQVAAGANDASKRVQSTAARCPDTKIVLGGYSQGAAVMDVITTAPVPGLGFAAPMPGEVAPHIAAVAVFGNPSARVGMPLTIMSPIYGARTADLCNTGDPICSAGRDIEAHSRYQQAGLVKLAAEWIAGHVQPRESAGSQYSARDGA